MNWSGRCIWTHSGANALTAYKSKLCISSFVLKMPGCGIAASHNIHSVLFLSNGTFVCMCVCVCVHARERLFVCCWCTRMFSCLCECLSWFVHLSVFLSVCRSACLSVCLSVYLSVYLSARHTPIFPSLSSTVCHK